MDRRFGGPKNKTFGAHFSKDIILCENDEIINIQTNVPETFNNFFINVAKDIGSKDVNIDNNHPSIKTIINNKTENREFVEKQKRQRNLGLGVDVNNQTV
jgi:hypothetical protein